MKRSIVSLAAGFCLFLGGSAHAETWPNFQGPGGNPFSAVFPGVNPEVRWTSAIHAVNSGGCVVADQQRAYVIVQDTFDPTYARVVALNRATGSTVWQSNAFVAAGTMSCPAVSGSSVVVPTGYSEALTNTPGMRQFDTATGADGWTNSFTGGGMLAGAIAISDGVAYASVVGLTGCPFNSFGAWRLSDGVKQWCVAGDQTEPPPVVLSGSIVQTNRSVIGIVAMDPANNGATLWSDAQGFAPRSAVGTDRVVHAVGYQASSLRLRNAVTGSQLWQFNLPSGLNASQVSSDASRVYVAASGNSGRKLYALSQTTGAVVWQLTPPESCAGGASVFGTRVVASRCVYDSATGALISTEAYPLANFPLSNGAAAVDGELLRWVSSDDGSYEVQAVRDATPPAVTGVGPADGTATTDATPTFSFTVSDGLGSGLIASSLTLDGVATDVMGQGAFTAATLQDGTHSWSIAATDAVGNQAAVSRSVVVDTVPPDAFAISAPTGIIDQSRPQISWSPANDVTSGIDHYDVRIDNASTVVPSNCQSGCTLQVGAALGDGSHEAQVTAVDRAGLATSTPVRPFTVAAPPQAAVTTRALVVQTGQSISFDASGSSDNSGIASYAWDPEGDGTFEAATGPTRVVTFTEPGSHAVAVRVVDGAGLVSTASATVDVRRAAPPGELGVSINDGAIATNDPNVSISAVWPRFALTALVSNDGGFGAAGSTRSVLVTGSVPWRLASSGPERLPKTVYVRFSGGDAGRETYTDDIILDETAPRVAQAGLVNVPAASAASRTASSASTRKRIARVRLTASDNAAGVVGVQLTTQRRNPGKIIRVKRTRRLQRTVSAKVVPGKLFARVIDAAGNPSKWRAVTKKRR